MLMFLLIGFNLNLYASKKNAYGNQHHLFKNTFKQKFNAPEVHMLTFDVADGSGDFTSLTDLNNYPTEKTGNHVFYFVFKDPTDGLYKFSGGRLRKLYEGNGVYSEAYIFPYSPIMSGDPVYPHDQARKSWVLIRSFILTRPRLKNSLGHIIAAFCF